MTTPVVDRWRDGRPVTSRATWAEAVAEAGRRRRVCLEKFGPGLPHGWRFKVVRRRERGSHHVRWYVTTGSIR